MGSSVLPRDQVYWYTLKNPVIKQLTHDTQVDVAVVGGGAAGLAAAYAFGRRGLSVALLEREFCGAGASGKSSGFISPDSELEVANLTSRLGNAQAQQLWDFSRSGVEALRTLIHEFNLNCDYQEQPTLFIANGYWGLHEVKREHQARQEIKYPSIFYTQEQLKQLITPHGTIVADTIILAVDRFLPEFTILSQDIYHAQTFLLISKPLTDRQVCTIFPHDNHMVTDTALVFNYYRITGDNRLLLGGADVLSTYACCDNHRAQRVFNKLTRYFKHKFPTVTLTFEYMWPGLLGISKDLLPIAELYKQQPYIYYISGATGLSWATALGLYSAEHILDKRTDMDHFFSSKRNFAVGHTLQALIGTSATFALANSINKFLR
jgi:gamma-glutamylputrescine oxidase